MRASTSTVTFQIFSSEVDPTITSKDPQAGFTIAWADAHPVVYKIVTSAKSKAFGIGSSVHMGWAANGKTPEAVIERLTTLRRAHEEREPPATGPQPDRERENIFCWRARFTVDHFSKKGFTGGFFQQHAVWPADGKTYARSCLTLDYTPETLEEVLDRFCGWMDPFFRDTTHVTLEGEIVRRFPSSA